MKTNSPFKYSFILILLFGFISSAQSMRSVATSILATDLSEANFMNVAPQKPAEYLEYSGYVVNRNTGDPIAGAYVEMKNSSSGIVTKIRTDQNGYYEFSMASNEKNKLVFVGDGYSEESRIVKTGGNLKSSSKNNRIYLTPFDSLVETEGGVKKIKVDSTYFQSHKSNTKGIDEMALEKALFTMLKFPEIKIKIEYHSNAGGSEVSNSVLSYFQAKAARKYLISQGVDASRIESANGINSEKQQFTADAGSSFIIVQ